MGFDDLREQLKAGCFDTLRIDCDNFFEAVVIHDEVQKLTERLERFFGEPVWPSPNRPGYEIQQTIESVGGLTPGQTMYYSGAGAGAVFAMLWPWRDGKHTTVKIINK